MSQVIPSPESCCNPCTPSSSASSSSTPGPQGEQGEQGEQGDAGISPITFVDDYSPDPQPTMPGEGLDVTVDVTSSTLGFEVGEPVFVQNWGTMLVTSVAVDSLTLRNLEDTASGTYAGNAAPGTSLAATSKIIPTGFQGPTGAPAVGALLSANDLSDVSDVPTSRTNLGLGDVATLTAGVGNANVAQNDGALTNGEVLFASAAGIVTVPDATARTNLGLGDMAVQDSNNVNIQGGQYNGTVGNTTPDTGVFDSVTSQGLLRVAGRTFFPTAGIQTLAAANSITITETKVRVAGSGGAVILTSTPTINAPTADGQILTIMGTDAVNTVTLQDESNFANTKLRLAGGNDVTLGLYDTLSLMYDDATGFWVQTGASDN